MKEGNKLIADFMGYPKSGEGTTYYYAMRHCYENHAMKYHSSWDWLIPVVDRIESLGFDSRILGNNSDSGYLCDFSDVGNNEIYCETSYSSKIETVYRAVIGFIKWHNKIKE